MSKNPLISGRNPTNRKQSMLERLTQPNIQNISPNYGQPNVALPTTQKQLVVVTLDKLRPYEGNPRRTKNPAFEEIKASIKARGLDHAPNVTQRPGDDFYTIADGGNTRLQALTELFQETQDSRFWSIECVFKAWQGDDIDSELNMLIGHLAENDVRGDLTFIEKALGIREVKALYEKKYNEFFSHRKLADKLGENGYPISHQIIAKMEQCLTYLHPHIPNLLLNGMGKPQIDKLIGIHNKASTSWEKYQEQYPTSSIFDEIWMHVLSPFDEDTANFSIAELQDTLIGKMVEAFNYQISYDALKLEIDLEERKLKKLIEKQAEIEKRATISEQHLQAHQEQLERKSAPKTVEKEKNIIPPLTPEQNPSDDVTPVDNFAITNNHTDKSSIATETELLQQDSSDELANVMTAHLAGFGIVSESAREAESASNDLAFANTGRQPISNIWKIYPNRKHKMDAYSIALDIAEECGIEHLVQHVVYDPVDYSFDLLPLDIESPSLLVKSIYALLSALRTDQLDSNAENIQLTIPSELLLGSLTSDADISDLMLVRLFRLIRLIRHLKTTYRQGEQNA